MRSTISSSARTGKSAALCLGLSLIVGMMVEDAVAHAPDPQSNVRGFYDTLMNTMKNGRSLGQSGRYARLAPVVDRIFDVPSMTRLTIGASWPCRNRRAKSDVMGAVLFQWLIRCVAL
jgi:hypothetical protein